MEIRQLRYMLKIAEERSFSKAAKQLYITQPSLSHYIANLEKQLGVKLFDRTNSPLTLTDAGKLFAEKARNVLNQHDELLVQINEIASCKTGELTIGISSIRGANLLPQVLPVFCERFPGIEINLIQENSKELIELTCNGTTSLSILPLSEKPKLLEYVAIQQEELLVSLPPKHPLLPKAVPQQGKRYPQISLALLKDEPFIIPKKTNLLRPVINDLFNRAGFSPKILLETDCITTAYSLVTSGMGIGFWYSTLEGSYHTEPPVHCSLDYPSPVRTVAIAYKAGKYLSKAEHEFIAITKSVVNPCPPITAAEKCNNSCTTVANS